jgi:hypothetical protein
VNEKSFRGDDFALGASVAARCKASSDMPASRASLTIWSNVSGAESFGAAAPSFS